MQYMKKKHCRKKNKICDAQTLTVIYFSHNKIYIYPLHKNTQGTRRRHLGFIEHFTPAFKSSVKLRCDFSCLIKKKNLYTCTCILPFKLNIFIYRILLELFKFY